MKYFALTGVVLATLVTGCAQMGGAQEPDAIPQKSVIGEPRTWSHPASFDAVPAELTAAGNAECAKLDSRDAKFRATGYDTQANDSDGSPFPNGGYYCSRRAPKFGESSSSASLPSQVNGR